MCGKKESCSSMNYRIGVVGLGYVGIPLAVAFARKFPVVGYDIDEERVKGLRNGFDRTGEVSPEELRASSLRVTSRPEDLRECNVLVVTVPTPVDRWNRPDLGPVIRATEAVGSVLSPGSIVVYESTVYPGVTEEICRPLLARVSGLTPGKDFTVGYSPERINPGDRNHRVHTIVKVVSGEDPKTLEAVAEVYGAVVEAGVHKCSSIRVAEAAKVIENTQRDLNIALMNELALLFDRMDIRTEDVLRAAGTKWNFLPFRPGLVGGHCIGVDPYYLTFKAEEVGYIPQVILAGRRINDDMGRFVARKTVKLLSRAGYSPREVRVGIFGLTFKENVPDLRNSRVPDIVEELRSFGIAPLVTDPLVTSAEAEREYGLALTPLENMRELDAVILAVAHDDYRERGNAFFEEVLRKRKGIFVDVKSLFERGTFGEDVLYWSL